MDPSGGYQATPGPTGLTGARVVYEFVPSTGQWQPVTYFPEEAMTPEESLLNEFACHYISDELPSLDPEDRASWLPAWAAGSARRLRRDAGAEGVSQVVALLRSIRADPHHPVVDKLSRESNIEWRDDDAWPGLQAILDEIARNLESPPNG